jgi:hypothetical protein
MQMTPELRERFRRFREVYEARRLELVEGQASGRLVATEPYKAAQQAVPLTLDELHLYKKLTALHSVNGGELFAV